MPRMVERICANNECRTIFQARVADVARGWAKFCSKSCKAVVQESRTHQYRNHIRREDSGDCIGHPFESGYFGHGQE
jgi:hypothetical protein